jgi:hypothetical protein
MSQARARIATAVQDKAAALRGSEATLNEQLARDTSGKLLDEVLDELSVAAATIESALEDNPNAADARVLRDLLTAIRSGESLVTETWNSVHA